MNTEVGQVNTLNEYFSFVNTLENSINPVFKFSVNDSVRFDNLNFNPSISEDALESKVEIVDMAAIPVN